MGLIQLKDVVCRGNETSIMECRHQQPGLKDSACSAHTRDVSVLCTGKIVLSHNIWIVCVKRDLAHALYMCNRNVTFALKCMAN